MTSFKYPTTLNETDTDCVTFSHKPYEPNDCRYFAQRGASAPGSGNTVTLYMPPTTPAAGYGQNWNDSGDKFAGPIRQYRSSIARSAVQSMGQQSADPLVGALDLNNGAKYQGLARDAATGLLAKLNGTSANELLGMTEGRIYNPNIEMLYNGPQLRGFSFTFDMVAFNRQDTEAISNIVKEFKAYSAPEVQQNSMFMTLPHVWDITYIVKGSKSKYMNSFKTCVLQELSVTDNGNSEYHMTFPDGEPVQTSIAMRFNETKIVTRKDHMDLPRGF